MRFPDPQQRFPDQIHIRTVRHAYRDVNSDFGIFIAPIGYVLANEIRVGHDNRHTVKGLNHGAARTDRTHAALNAAYLYIISYLYRAFKQQDRPANEIVRDILQTEADSHHQYRTNRSQRGQINPLASFAPSLMCMRRNMR